MQRIITNKPEKIHHTFLDDNNNPIKDMSGVIVTVRDADGVVLVDGNGTSLEDVSATEVSGKKGTFYYQILLPTTVSVQGVESLFGSWWTGTSSTFSSTLRGDTPEIFQAINAAAGIIEAAIVENARTRLLMQINRSGKELAGTKRFENKFSTDMELTDHVYDAQDDFNIAPPKLTFLPLSQLVNLNYTSLLTQGVIIHALVSLEILEAGKHFTYSDMGISFTRDRHSKYAHTAQRLLQQYLEVLKSSKQTYAMRSVEPRGLFSQVAGLPRSLDRALRGTHKMNWMSR